MRRHRLLVLGLALLAIGIAGLTLPRTAPLMSPRWSGTPVADGETIFRTGIGEDDQWITYSDGPPMRMACLACHGEGGQGGRVQVMMRSVEAPAITWPALTEEDHANDEPEHAPYTEETIRQAVTQGIDPAGKPLDPLMPRWHLTDAEWAALLAYLRTLE